jgi:cell division inhibitor SepF
MGENKFLDKVKFFMGMSTDSGDDEYDDEFDDAKDNDYGSAKPQPTANSLYPSGNISATRNPSYGSSSYNQAQGAGSSKLVNINKPMASSGPVGLNMKVIIFQPTSFDDTKTIVDNLKNKKPVILNIEAMEKEMAQKIFNFCSGALYALDGHIQQIAQGIFILAPTNVDVSGDLKSELESKGMFNLSGGGRE